MCKPKMPTILRLLLDRLHYGWVGVTKYEREVSAPIVSIFVPVNVYELRSMRFFDEEGVWFKVPVLV